jgi:hypothetical protein
MTAGVQTVLALAIVALAAAWLVRRAVVKKKNSGCGGECACPSQKISATLKPR